MTNKQIQRQLEFAKTCETCADCVRQNALYPDSPGEHMEHKLPTPVRDFYYRMVYALTLWFRCPECGSRMWRWSSQVLECPEWSYPVCKKCDDRLQALQTCPRCFFMHPPTTNYCTICGFHLGDPITFEEITEYQETIGIHAFDGFRSDEEIAKRYGPDGRLSEEEIRRILTT